MAKQQPKRPTVYLLHFCRPLHHAQHYLGYAGDLDQRIDQHRTGNGARLVRVCAEHGIDFLLVRTWEGGRDLERHLKNQHNGRKLCPICSGRKWQDGGDHV